MKAVEVKRKIAQIDARLGKLEPWLETLTRARKRLIIRDDDRSRHDLELVERGSRSHVGGEVEMPNDRELFAGFEARLPGRRDTEVEIALLREELGLLEAELPSPAQVAEAKKQTAALLQQIAKANARDNEASRAFGEHLREAYAAAYRKVEASQERLNSLSEAREVADQYGFDLDVVPGEPLEAQNRQLNYLMAIACQEVALTGEIDSTTGRDLLAEMRRSRRAAAA